jgi:hypothetical protein
MYRSGMTPIDPARPNPAAPLAERWARTFTLGAACVSLAGCMVGPNYVPPSPAMPLVEDLHLVRWEQDAPEHAASVDSQPAHTHTPQPVLAH